MKKILEKYSDCNTFSLTGGVFGYHITEDEFYNALNEMELYNKEKLRKMYDDNREKFVNYPEFDELYEEIKQECLDFDSEENRKKRIEEYYTEEVIKQYKEMGITDEQINRMKENGFSCSCIVDDVGKKTKYGSECPDFFWWLYNEIAMNIERYNDKKKYFVDNEKDLLDRIPKELKEHFLYYEISFYNSVTIKSILIVNYYFKLNDETKNYLLQFRNDFCLDNLEDLTLYKDNEEKFSSCTHEGYNSIEFDYKKMTNDEIIEFINDEYFKEDNSKIIYVVN